MAHVYSNRAGAGTHVFAHVREAPAPAAGPWSTSASAPHHEGSSLVAPRDPDRPLAAGLRRNDPGLRSAPAAIDRTPIAAFGAERRVIDSMPGGGPRDRAHIDDRLVKRQEGRPDARDREADAE